MKNYSVLKFFPKALSRGFFSLATAFSLLFTVSCGGGGGGVSADHVQIPADVTYVVSMDLKKLTSKSKNWREIFDKDFLETMDVDADEARDIMDKILNSGIDYDKKAYAFGTLAKDEQDNFVGFSFLLSDPAKFEQALKESDKKPEIKTDGDLSYVIDEDNMIGWKNKTALFFGPEDNLPEGEMLNNFKAIFNTEAGNSLSSKSNEFTTIDAAGHDFAFWVNQQQINELNTDFNDFSFDSPFFEEMNKIALSLTGGVSFEKGAINAKFTTHLDKELSGQYEELWKTGIHNNIINSTPIETPSTIMGIGLSMKILYERLKNESMLKDSDREVQKEFGLTIKEIFEMFDGDFLLTLNDIQSQTLLIDPQPEFVFAMGIANKKNLQKILDFYEEQRLLEKSGEYYIMRGLPNPIYLLEKGDILYVTMTDKYKDDLVSGKGSIESKYANAVSKKSFVMYMDVKETMKQIPAELTDGSTETFQEAVVPELEDVIMNSTPIRNQKAEGEIVINFTNKSENALVTLVNIIKKLEEKEGALSLQ